MRISDWSSDVCSSDLPPSGRPADRWDRRGAGWQHDRPDRAQPVAWRLLRRARESEYWGFRQPAPDLPCHRRGAAGDGRRPDLAPGDAEGASQGMADPPPARRVAYHMARLTPRAPRPARRKSGPTP